MAWILCSATVMVLLGGSHARTLVEIMSETPELSEFSSLVEGDELMKLMMSIRSVTVFAPNNEAIRDFKQRHEKVPGYLVPYHICNEKLNSYALKSRSYLSSQIDGNLPLWISTKSRGEVLTVNNAQIIKTDIEGTTSDNEDSKTQILHVIDRVIEPLVPTPQSGDVIRNPTASHLIENAWSYGIDYVIPDFKDAVKSMSLLGLFSNSSEATYFIPVGSRKKFSGIDAQVIRGHVIPDQVLFLRTMIPEQRYPSKNTNTLIVLRDDYGVKKDRIIESITLRGDTKHLEGVVSVKVVKANIPVKNGVVHLVGDPLVLVSKHITELLKADKRLTRFSGLDSKQLKTYEEDITLLAPINKAFQCLDNDPSKMQEFLKWHVIGERCLAMFHEKKSDECKSFKWENKHMRKYLVVEGGGVTANVLDPNIAAKNGILHVIDRLLGMPFQSMLHQMEQDGQLNYTSTLINENINDMADTSKTFTVLAPTDEAWGAELFEEVHRAGKSKLTETILGRHIIYEGDVTMDDMVWMSKDGTVKTEQAELLVRRVGEGYEVEWNGMVAQIVSHDLTCARGRLHVIDKVFITEEELKEKETTLGPQITTQTRTQQTRPSTDYTVAQSVVNPSGATLFVAHFILVVGLSVLNVAMIQ